GQPMHAFDFAKLDGGELVIRYAKDDEAFQALDSKEYALKREELVIADKTRVVALAGIIGGLDSGVSEVTQNIFLESAFFAAQNVRRTARARGIETDSAYRFSRGVNPEHAVLALEAAAKMVLEIAGGAIVSDIKDLYPTPIKRDAITITTEKVENRLGYKVDKNDFHKVLERLGCSVSGDKVTVPAHRWDLNIAEDLIEEYARMHGYEKLGENLPKLSTEPTAHNKTYLTTRRLTEYLSKQGLSQAINYAFLHTHLQKTAMGDVSSVQVTVKNPVSEDFGVMRVSLLPSLLNNVSFNVRHGNANGDVFEIAPVVQKNAEEFLETLRLGFAFWGEAATIWGGTSAPVVYRLKSHVENLINSEFPGEKFSWEVPDVIPPLFHPQQCVSLMFRGKKRGILGSIHPQIAKDYKLKMEVAFAELPVEEIFTDKKVVRFKEIPMYPIIEKDVSFVIPQSVKAETVKKEMVKLAGDMLKSVTVIDQYQGPPLKENERSIAFRFQFQKSDRTLSDDEVNTVFNKVIEATQAKLPVTLRK
ncbi:MAG: phenylalanine--tRNA ligase subunit beta, partial [Bdellovibrionaceae bacterium]|nr:phenylalanine--tRNA ligase subunit beta [Pseudobdellovibrionaceae bacterium]